LRCSRAEDQKKTVLIKKQGGRDGIAERQNLRHLNVEKVT
jgi:hypothetical protein